MLVSLFLLLRFPYVLGVQDSIWIVRFLQNSRYSMETNAPLLSDWIFSVIPYNLKLLDEKFVTSLVSAVLHIFTVGHSLNLFTDISICTSPCMIWVGNFPVKSFSDSWAGSARVSNFP